MWGEWQIPESELHLLGDVSGKDILEFGCGAAELSIALTRAGASCVGLDASRRHHVTVTAIDSLGSSPLFMSSTAERSAVSEAEREGSFATAGCLRIT